MTPLTKTEIDMFAKAKEIQGENWTLEVGDRYCDKTQEIEWLTPFNLEYVSTYPQCYIFLPSIEQMAGMWHETPGAIFLIDLAKFVEKDLREDGYISEQPLPVIVLAFIQHDLFSKRWDEKEGWVDA